MRRGELWIASGRGVYSGKPRPAIIIQSEGFPETASITVCLTTTVMVPASLARLPVQPTERNGLREPCWIMADKISTISRTGLGRQIGELEDDDLLRLDRALRTFLGLGHKSRGAGKSAP